MTSIPPADFPKESSELQGCLKQHNSHFCGWSRLENSILRIYLDPRLKVDIFRSSVSVPILHHTSMALENLKDWTPFSIDALGLVTILGADEVDRAVGRLTRSFLTDWVPLLGAYTISSDRVTEAIPGFTLYNITDGISSTDISGWFGRWLLCQDLAFSTSTIRISVVHHGHQHDLARRICSTIIGMVTLAPILVMALLIGDWWGLANAISMLVSVLVRRVVVSVNSEALDRAVLDPSYAPEEVVKVFLTTPSGKGVTILAPRVVVINCLLTKPRPRNRHAYLGARAAGWVAFGVHVISLGMSSLFIQILSTFVILVGTMATVYQIGSRECQIGSRLMLEQVDTGRDQDYRAAAYARLLLSEKEEESMVQWHLFPHRSNQHWWAKYRLGTKHGKLGSPGFTSWATMLAESGTT